MVYPNPLRGEGPIRVAFALSEETEEVRVTVVTVAYRKVHEQAFSTVGRKGNLSLVLDRGDMKLANGLYYVLVRYPSGHQAVGKFVVLR